MDDDDEVAIDDGIEPATDAKGEPIAASSAAAVETVAVRKGTRPVSETVRRVFAESLAKMRKSGEDEGSLEPVEHEELPQEAAPVVKGEDVPAITETVVAAAPTVPVAAPVSTAPTIVAPPAQPPAPSLDPEVLRLREDYTKRMTELDAREAQIQAQQRASDVAKLREQYYEKGAPAIAEVVKQWMPGLSDDEMKDEIADLIQDLSHQFLGAPLDQTVKDRIATKRTRAGLKSWRQEQERQAEEQQKKLLATQEEENRVRVKRILHSEVTKPEHAPQFPFLASEANAGDLVFETIDQEYRTTGQQLTWVEAAKRVDDWLKSQALAFYDRRKHLLSPQPPPQQQPAPSDKQRTQGDSQVSRSQAPPKPPAKPAPPQDRPVEKWTPERHRESVKQKFRAQLKNQFSDGE